MTEAMHLSHRKLIDRHFAGRGRPASEATLRAHMIDCATCRRYYDAHLVLAAADPAALPPETRIARGLGFGRSERSFARLTPLLAIGLVATGLVLVAHPKTPAPTATVAEGEFVARGAPPAAPHPDLQVFRVSGRVPAALGDRMNAGDALAFAYLNPTGYAFLSVIGVDEAAHVYWYHPNPDERSEAVPITRTTRAAELPEAIRHHYRGRSLRIVGVFSQQALSVDQVARAVDGRGCPGVRAHLPGTACVETKVAIGPGEAR